MAYQTDKGVIDATDRVLSQLLESTTFKNSVRMLLNHFDADASRRLARTVLWKDMDFTLALLAVSPALANTVIQLADEILDQVNDKFPPQLLAEYTEQVLAEIDAETLAQVRQKALGMYEALSPVIERSLLGEGTPASGRQAADESGGMFPAGGDPAPTGETPDDTAIPESDGVLAEVLRTSFLKDILREVLNGIDAERAAPAARSLLWEDMESVFSVMGALPPIINFYLQAAAEIGEQLADKIPPRLFASFLAEILSGIDTDTARKGVETYRRLGEAVLREAGPDLDARVQEMLTSPALAQTLAGGLNQGVSWINRVEANHPGTLRDLMANVSAATDTNEVNRAARHMAEAVLDQRPPFFRLVWRTVKLYVAGLFKRNP